MRPAPILTLALLVATPVAAQEISTTVTALTDRTSVDLTDLSDVTIAPIRTAECDDSHLISFRFSGVDATRAQLHLFYGASCNDSTVRNDATDTSCTDLGLEYAISSRSQVDQDIPVSSLIDCSTATSGTRTIWVLALDEPTSDVTGAGQQNSFPIAYDFVGPSAPQDFAARNGETAATLTWTGSTDEISKYEIYLVPDGCDASGTVTTTALSDPNNPDATYLARTETSGSVTTTTVDLPAGGTGGHHAVAIRGIDNSGNAGPLSDVVCVDQVSVQTFWDTYCTGGGHAACNSAGYAAAPGPAAPRAGLALGVIAVLLGLRRRRS